MVQLSLLLPGQLIRKPDSLLIISYLALILCHFKTLKFLLGTKGESKGNSQKTLCINVPVKTWQKQPCQTVLGQAVLGHFRWGHFMWDEPQLRWATKVGMGQTHSRQILLGNFPKPNIVKRLPSLAKAPRVVSVAGAGRSCRGSDEAYRFGNTAASRRSAEVGIGS